MLRGPTETREGRSEGRPLIGREAVTARCSNSTLNVRTATALAYEIATAPLRLWLQSHTVPYKCQLPELAAPTQSRTSGRRSPVLSGAGRQTGPGHAGPCPVKSKLLPLSYWFVAFQLA
jgi:hypothetical protein